VIRWEGEEESLFGEDKNLGRETGGGLPLEADPGEIISLARIFP